MKPSMAQNSGGPFPLLKGKAAEARHLGKALLLVWRDYQDRTLQHHRMVEKVLDLSVKLEDILDKNCHLLNYPDELAERFLRVTLEYNATVTWLCRFYHAKDGAAGRFFKFVLKNHYLVHAAYLARYLNPVRTWCYQGESLLFRIKKLIASVTKMSVAKHDVCNTAMLKYCKGYECILRSRGY